jgi:hypothetical protein
MSSFDLVADKYWFDNGGRNIWIYPKATVIFILLVVWNHYRFLAGQEILALINQAEEGLRQDPIKTVVSMYLHTYI